MAGDSSPCLSVYGLISVKMANDLIGLDQPKQLSLADGVRDWYRLLTCRDEIIVLTKAIIIVKDWITMLRKASAARVNRRLRRYYLIVRLLPNVFALACLPLSSI